MKKVAPGEKKIAVTASIPLEVLANVYSQASERGVSVSRIFTEILTEHFSNHTRSGHRSKALKSQGA